ncbi:MAG TPA: inositol monophosphatase family protein [Rhodothermia bacterium]|nr:inositol monophosphatase family protein [Rhodothermia bacterium]
MMPNEFEAGVLARWRNGSAAPPRVLNPDDPSSWIHLALHFALVASRIIRTARLGDLDGAAVRKGDGSPVTAIEHLIEERIEGELRTYGIPITLIGEETAPDLPGSGMALAIDPVDGTWSLLNRTETLATSLAIFRDGEAIAGTVANPATAEIAYTAVGHPPRLLQLGAFGEGDRGVTLPIPPAGPEGLLVSLHPQRVATPIAGELARAWEAGELDMVRTTGGAPSLGLLEAAKGSFAYVNLWGRREAAAWDLAAGMLLVRAAGGDVVDLQYRPVQALGHRGPFVAALRPQDRERVIELVRSALRDEEV